jgi:hypothetical protein
MILMHGRSYSRGVVQKGKERKMIIRRMLRETWGE